MVEQSYMSPLRAVGDFLPGGLFCFSTGMLANVSHFKKNVFISCIDTFPLESLCTSSITSDPDLYYRIIRQLTGLVQPQIGKTLCLDRRVEFAQLSNMLGLASVVTSAAK